MGKLLITSLQKRAASAMVLIPLTVAVIFYGGLPFAAFLGLLAFLSLYEWFKASFKTSNPIVFSVFGFVYVLISLWCCFLIRENYTIFFALLFIVMIWASDIGAYVLGKTIKGPKMASKISPNKTWSGYVGALVFPGIVPIVALILYAFISGDMDALNIGHGFYLFLVGVVIGFAGQSGDLLVSFLKRKANVKDTGHLIPGHGGILDRIDSMLLAAPIFLFIASEFSHVTWH